MGRCGSRLELELGRLAVASSDMLETQLVGLVCLNLGGQEETCMYSNLLVACIPRIAAVHGKGIVSVDTEHCDITARA